MSSDVRASNIVHNFLAVIVKKRTCLIHMKLYYQKISTI